MSANEQKDTGAANGAEQGELSNDALESVSGGIVGDCTGGGWPTKPGKPGQDWPPFQTPPYSPLPIDSVG